MAQTSDGDASASPLLSINSIGNGNNRMTSIGAIRQRWKAFTKGTVFSSVFTLLTTSIGAGTLSLPFGFSQGGLVLSSAVFFSIMIIAVLVGFMLFSAKRYCTDVYPKKEVWGYEDLADAAFGAVGKIAVLLTLIILLFLALIAYMIYARDQLDLVVQFALSKTGHIPDCSPLVNCALLMAMAFLPIFPITLLRDLTPMQITSTVSILCICYVALVMTIKTSIAWVHFNAGNTTDTIQNPIPEPHHVQVWPSAFSGLLTVISYCSLAFICQFNLLPLQKELHNPTKRRLNIIVISSVVIAYIIYNIVIFMGYFNFFDTTKEDIMLNYSRDDILVTTARVALFLTLLFSYPVLLHPTRGAINRLLGLLYDLLVERMSRKRWEDDSNTNGDLEAKQLLPGTKIKRSEQKKVPTLVWFLETWILFGATFLPASFIPNVGYVWNFVGSTGGVLVLYIFPPAFYLRLRYLRYVHRARLKGCTICSQYDRYAVCKEVIAFLILLLGCFLLILTNYQAIDAVVDATHEPSSLCFQIQCGHQTEY